MNDDPKFKWDLMQGMLHQLYQPFMDMQRRELKEITVQNSLLHKNNQLCFRFKGEEFRIEHQRDVRRLNSLHESLQPRMKEWMALQAQVKNEERPYVENALTQVLNSSESIEDYYLLLPDALHPILNDFRPIAPPLGPQLTDQQLDDLRLKNQKGIGFMKSRMVMNLLLV